MALREHLLAVADELRRLKAEGRKTVSVGDDTLLALKRVIAVPREIVVDDRSEAPERIPASRAVAPSAPAPVVPAPVLSVARTETSTKPVAPAASIFSESPKTPPLKVASARAGETLPPPPAFDLPAGDKATQWRWLRDFVVGHEVCKAHVRPGKKVVLGVGSVDAEIFFCGEAPGAEEEIQGEPFVGAAGQLLTKMIKAMGLDRSQVYIGNIMNWRPEMPTPPGIEQVGNRPPTADEMAFCLPFLRAQLAIVRPKMIVALGATAAKGLLGENSFATLGEIRGRWQSFAGVPVMVTYHPSYLLRNNSTKAKRAVWEDLLLVMERAEMPINDKQRNYFLDK